MTRFVAITSLTLALAATFGFVLTGRARLWALFTLWAIYSVLFTLGITWVKFQFFCPTILRGPTDQPRVALTFDDGPDPASTPALLDLLARENVPAIFFCIGRHVDASPQLAARLVAEGHLIGNHTQDHKWWTCLMIRPLLWGQIDRCQAAIVRAVGALPSYARPPVGLTNMHFASAMKRHAMQLVGWSIRPLDTVRSAEQVIDHITRRAKNGSIILLHDGGVEREKLLTTVRGVIEQLRARGFVFDRLDTLLGPHLHPKMNMKI